MVTISALKLRAIYQLQNSDWPVLTGLLAIVVSALLALMTVSMQSRSESESTKLTRSTIQARAVKAPESDNILTQFYRVLPSHDQVDKLSASIFQTADGLGLKFVHAEFSSSLVSAGLVVCRIKLPVTGSYMQVRQFLTALLNAHPTLALDTMQIQREDAYAPSVEANLIFTLYLRGEAK